MNLPVARCPWCLDPFETVAALEVHMGPCESAAVAAEQRTGAVFDAEDPYIHDLCCEFANERECGSCDDDNDINSRCYSCGGSGWYVPAHCCGCGGSPYCLCCKRCGAECVAACRCPMTIELGDGRSLAL